MKLLTYDIIEAELAKRGCSQKQIEDDPSGFTEKVLNHYEARVDDRWADQDLYVYEESTRDGYSVWVCTHNPNSVCIAEEIYYNNNSSDIIEQLQDAIRNGASIYCDDTDLIDEAVEQMIDTFYDDLQADTEMKLIDQGYVWPTKIPHLLQEIWETMSNEDTADKHKNLLNRINVAIEQLNNKNDN